MSGASGRSGTGSRPYRRNRAKLLSISDICALCGHGGAMTADHIIPKRYWPRDEFGKLEPGFDGLDNLQPAHGTMGNSGAVNRCLSCGLACNQVKGDRTRRPPRADPEPYSRRW